MILVFPHPGIAVEEQTWHPVSRRIGEQILKPRQRCPRIGRFQPTICPDPGDPFFDPHVSILLIHRLQMAVLRHDHSSTDNGDKFRNSLSSSSSVVSDRMSLGGGQRSRLPLHSSTHAACLTAGHFDDLPLGFDSLENQVFIDRLKSTSSQSGHGLSMLPKRDPWSAEVCKPNRPAFAVRPVGEYA